MFSKAFIAVAATIFASANAHLAIEKPVPFPDSASKSPLDPSGSNFPCQGSSLSGGTVTNLQAGSTSPLQFNLGGGANTAVHGGGSCQISITYETDPAALKDPNNWKVLHSFIGGCPTEAMGNLDQSVPCSTGNEPQCVRSFNFNVPSELQNGNGILAWTWFNNVGNREMYMNCAPVSVSGGSGNIGSLPSMFAANIGNGCATTESFNTDFPNPGQYVTKGDLNYPLKAPTGSCASGAGSGNTPSTPSTPSGSTGGSTGTSPSSGAGTRPSAAASSAAAAPPSQTTGRGGRKPGTFAEGAGTAPSAVATTLATVAASSLAAPSPAPQNAVVSPPANGSSSGSCSAGQVSCSSDGFYCIDSTHFGLCAWGCATPMAVAAGTTCSGSSIAAAKVKRHLHMRHARRHLFGITH
jgi:hypothetical protein